MLWIQFQKMDGVFLWQEEISQTKDIYSSPYIYFYLVTGDKFPNQSLNTGFTDLLDVLLQYLNMSQHWVMSVIFQN